MKRFVSIALLFVATAASAQVVATTPRGIAVAHDGRLDLFDPTAQRVIWSAEGVEAPARVVTSPDRIAVVDSLNNRAAVVDLASGRATNLSTGETPIDGVFAGGDLVLLERDAAALERIGRDGRRHSVALSPDPAFLRESDGRFYVYSRADGLVQEISPATLRVTRTLSTAPFASDFEIDGRSGYLLFPRTAKVKTFSIATMRGTGEFAAGVVPIDMAVTRKPGALSAATLSIADPSAKRVWVTEGAQSVAAAFTRGFIRGLLGLGLFEPRNSEFPTGVDRVVVRGSVGVAYDSTTGTLYRLDRGKAAVAHALAPGAFALTERGIAVWENGRLRLIR